MLYRSVMACVGRTPLVELGRQFPPPGPTVIAKLELMNPSGSMKDRSAAHIDRPLDCLVVPVSTTGTIVGLARRLRDAFPALHVVAVDAAGSVIFGGPPGPRHVPGLGAGRRSELLRPGEIDEVVSVSDREAVAGRRALASSEGILAGGSSGAVVAAIERLRPRLPAPWQLLTVLPDRGDRYLDQVYDDDWVARLPAGQPAAVVP